MAICGEKIGKLKTQVVIQWAVENEMVLVLNGAARTEQTRTQMPGRFQRHGEVAVPLNSQVMTRASESA